MTNRVADAVTQASTMARDPHDADPESIIGVSVPATSANLGPGYDALGVALDVPLVAVAVGRGDKRVTTVGFGAEELPEGDDNLVWRGVLAWCNHVGVAPPDVSLRVRSAIPLERGMGSSSAAAVAGLMLGRGLSGVGGSTMEVLRLATDLEGHPDNAAAAIVGGLVLCLDDGTFRRVSPSEALRPVLLIPATRQNTNDARTLLPDGISLTEAAQNGARAVAAFAGLAGLTSLQVGDMVDTLHEPSRLAIMPVARALVAALRAAEIPAVLSGAGPAVLAVVPAHDPHIAERLTGLVDEARGADGPVVEVLPTAWNLAGAQLCPPLEG